MQATYLICTTDQIVGSKHHHGYGEDKSVLSTKISNKNYSTWKVLITWSSLKHFLLPKLKFLISK